jgi:non-ribosomal peptide synthase protein (TIGR01720 family)
LPKNLNGKLDRKALVQLIEQGNDGQKGDLIPISPAQRWLMNYFEPPYRWTGYTRFMYKLPLDIRLFNKAYSLLIQRHDALRTVLVRKGNHWVQQIIPPDQVSTHVVFYKKTEIQQKERNQKVRELIGQSIEELKVDTWPLLKAIVIQVADDLYDITVVGHHLISDLITNQLLFKEMWQIYGQLATGSKVTMPPVKSYKDFVLFLEEQKRDHLDEFVQFWKNEFPSNTMPCHIPVDFQLGGNTEESARMECFTLERELTSILLGKAKKFFDSNVYPLLLAPLYKMLADRYQQNQVTISHRGHGRDAGHGMTFFDTVGNFAVNYPLGVSIHKQDRWMEIVQKIKDGLEKIPLGGISYDLVSSYLPPYLYPDKNLTSIRANYLGNRDFPKLSSFEFNKEDLDRRFSSPEQKRISEIEFFFSIIDGRLTIEIEYSDYLFQPTTIKELGNQYLQRLEAMIAEASMSVRGNMPSNGLLRNRVALITGGGRGIGRSIALALAKEGAQVAILARSVNQLEETAIEIRKLGIEPLVLQGDIGELNQVQQAMDRLYKEFGQLDLVVNNAGITQMGAIVDMAPEDWKRILQVNLIGTYHVCATAIPYLIKQQKGKIINIGSDSSFIGYPLMSAYSATKHGILGLTKSLSEELKPYHIQVNAVCPAMVDTDMIPGAFRKKAIPPEKVADIVAFLASDKADGITGEGIQVYGNQDMYWYGSEKMPMLKAVLGNPDYGK